MRAYAKLLLRTEVDPVTGCWNYTGALGKGYGRVRDEGGRSTLAHRVGYEELVGPIPEGLELDHLCRNRRCWNPTHLEPVTRKENLRRGMRATQTHCKRGHEFTKANTRWEVRGSVEQRHCKACLIILQRERRAKARLKDARV